MTTIEKIRVFRNYDDEVVKVVCHERDTQAVKTAFIGGKTRIVPLTGTILDEKKIPVIYRENKPYFPAVVFRREYYTSMIDKVMEKCRGIYETATIVTSEEWEAAPTTTYDRDAVMYEFHRYKEIPVEFYPEVLARRS